MRESSVEFDGTHLFAWEDGVGFPIVMLHGGMADHRAVLPTVRPLIDRYRIVTPDLRGSGKSWFGGELTFDLLADDLLLLLDQAGIEQAVMGGVSSGSGVALRFALCHPDRTRALALITPMYGGEAMGYTDAQRAAFMGMHAVASRALQEGVEVLRALYARLPDPLREKAVAMLGGWDAASVVATSQFLNSGCQPFVGREDLASLSIPTLVVRGNDAMHPSAVSDLYLESIPECSTGLTVATSVAETIGDFVDECLSAAA